jgi:lipoprotein-anchoring transpeptidase ErfK/SrfK
VPARLQPIYRHFSASSTTLNGIATAAMTACATLALLAGSAQAVPFGLGPSPRSEAAPPANLTRSAPRVRTASRPRHTAVAKPAPAAHDLASQAKGPLEILISLDKQQLTLYAGGEPIAHSRVSTGMRGRSTPTGVFSIIQKDRWHRSNLYDDAPMYFMQRITWSGVALHQGIVPNYPASHGCIRLPAAFAQQMWRLNSMGARVIITHHEVAPLTFSHPKLFNPKPAPVVASNDQAQSLQAAEQAWKIAMLDGTKPVVAMAMTDVPAMTPAFEAPKPAAKPLKPGPVSVFISRKEGKLFVRKGFVPLFDVPVTIEHPEAPLGTHVFTAISTDGDSAHWNVVSVAPKASASEALDRITIPQEAIDRISELLAPGASLVIADKGLGSETGKGTDFIVVNP